LISVEQLITVFNSQFLSPFNTRLQGGAEEPLYLPEKKILNTSHTPATIYFRLDYLSSALHEVSHWCIAGKKRRELEDYGYWYTPDSRDLSTQKKFESVEIKPQAIECIFHWCLNLPFKVSVDNLSLPDYDAQEFQNDVYKQIGKYISSELPERAHRFAVALLTLSSPYKDLNELLKQKYENHCR